MAAAAVSDPERWVKDLLVPPCDLAERLRKLRTAARLRNWVDGIITELSRDPAGGPPGAGTHAIVAGATNMSARDAKAVVARAGLVGHAPAVGEAMATGSISAAHADARFVKY